MRNSAPQLLRFLIVLADRRAALEQQREDIEAVLGEIDVLEKQCSELLGHDADNAADARAQIVRRMRSGA